MYHIKLNSIPNFNDNIMLFTNIITHILLLFFSNSVNFKIIVLNFFITLTLEILFNFIDYLSLKDNTDFTFLKLLLLIPFTNIIFTNIYNTYSLNEDDINTDQDLKIKNNDHDEIKDNKDKDEDEDDEDEDNEDEDNEDEDNEDEDNEDEDNEDNEDNEDEDEDDKDDDKDDTNLSSTDDNINKSENLQYNSDKDEQFELTQEYLEKYTELVILGIKSNVCLVDNDIDEIKQFIGDKLTEREFRLLIRKINKLIRQKI